MSSVRGTEVRDALLATWGVPDRVQDRSSVDYLLLHRQVEDFLFYECELLDGRAFGRWLDLLTDDITYEMPLRRNVRFGEWDRETTTGDVGIMWFADDKDTLRQRVDQIETGVHWADEPSGRVSHVVTNVRLLETTPSVSGADEVSVSCRFIVYRNRLETETDLFVGRRLDRLVKAEDTAPDGDGGWSMPWRIAQRTVILDQNVLLAKNLTVLF